VLLEKVKVGRDVHIRRAVIETGCTIPDGTHIGYDPAEDGNRFELSHGELYWSRRKCSARRCIVSDERLRVVLCWHMHQPEYRDPLTGEYQAPWTYLHAIKDYVDMAAHLEDTPDGVQAVVNFPPVLLEQITSYAKRIQDCLERDKNRATPCSPHSPWNSFPKRGKNDGHCLNAASRHTST